MTEAFRDIRWGMIGVGSVAEHKSGPAFAKAQGGRLTAVASRREETAAAYAARHGVEKVFATPAALIQSGEIDAVYIATPPSSHAALALQVAQAGKPCCIEKPMAVFYGDAQRIRETFAAVSIPLFVSYYRRSLPRFLQVAEWISKDEIGAVREVLWVLKRKSITTAHAQNWRVSALEAPGGLFEDLACHGLDVFDMLLGPITRIDRALLTASSGSIVPDRVQASWCHGDHVKGIGDWDFAAEGRADSITITGENGVIRFSMFENEAVELERNKRIVRLAIDNPVPIQLHHVEAINAHLTNGRMHPSTADSAIRTAWATDQILRGPTTDIAGFLFTASGEPAIL